MFFSILDATIIWRLYINSHNEHSIYSVGRSVHTHIVMIAVVIL